MKIGLFCFFSSEAPDGQGAIPAELARVQLAEKIGFDEAWVSEHHFDPHAVSPSILPLLAYLAAATDRIRLGSAAVLLPLHNPIQVAEDVATIDILSGGRFNFGVAKGGLFPGQNEQFGVQRQTARNHTMESLQLITRLLRERGVCFANEQHRVENLTLIPRPLQNPVPTWLASMTKDAVRFAARQDFGLMGTLLASAATLAEVADIYRDEVPGADPRLRVARFFHTAPTSQQAYNEARPAIAAFATRMHRNHAALAPNEPNNFSEANLMARSLVGSHAEVQDRIAALCAAAPVAGLMLKPAARDPVRVAASLREFKEAVLF